MEPRGGGTETQLRTPRADHEIVAAVIDVMIVAQPAVVVQIPSRSSRYGVGSASGDGLPGVWGAVLPEPSMLLWSPLLLRHVPESGPAASVPGGASEVLGEAAGSAEVVQPPSRSARYGVGSALGDRLPGVWGAVPPVSSMLSWSGLLLGSVPETSPAASVPSGAREIPIQATGSATSGGRHGCLPRQSRCGRPVGGARRR